MAFDVYSVLDKAKYMRDVEEELGPIFDQYSYLDNAYRTRQIEQATGVEISNDAMMNRTLMVQETVVAIEESSGGIPAWVPDDAKIHIDFINDRAWTEAGGEVAIATLLGTDPNTETGWGESGYDPAYLSANGYGTGVGGAPEPALLGALLTMYLSAGTFVVKSYNYEIEGGGLSVLALSADGNDAVEVVTHAGDGNDGAFRSWNGSLNASVTDAYDGGVGDINTTAFTFSGSRAEIAANGSTVATGVVTEDDRPPGNPLIAVMIDLGNQSLVSFTAYDALPSTTGLSELSEV